MMDAGIHETPKKKKTNSVKSSTKVSFQSPPSSSTKNKKRLFSSPNTSPSSSTSSKSFFFSSDVAQISPQNPWIDLNVSSSELRPSATLTTGQCFNFVVVTNDDYRNNNESHETKSAWGTHNETEWLGPIQNLILSIKETETSTLYRVLYDGSTSSAIKQEKKETKKNHDASNNSMSQFLMNYFQLDVALEPLYQKWSQKDVRLSKIAPAIQGVRIIRQDPVECLFSFICSSNNNIPRITKMLSSFREKYGTKLLDVPARIQKGAFDDDAEDDNGNVHNVSFYSFPTLLEMENATETELRDMGLGYRAKYIIQTRDLLIKNGGKDHLLSLRNIRDPHEVQETLLQYSGIGRKVADCVALFSLDQEDAIPVDVHVQHIASRDYDPSVLGSAKSLTPTIYRKVGDLFRDRFVYAGWAHSLLFVAELPSFRNVLPDDVVAEMDAWKEAETAKKIANKEAKTPKTPSPKNKATSPKKKATVAKKTPKTPPSKKEATAAMEKTKTPSPKKKATAATKEKKTVTKKATTVKKKKTLTPSTTRTKKKSTVSRK